LKITPTVPGSILSCPSGCDQAKYLIYFRGSSFTIFPRKEVPGEDGLSFHPKSVVTVMFCNKQCQPWPIPGILLHPACLKNVNSFEIIKRKGNRLFLKIEFIKTKHKLSEFYP